MAGLYHGHIPEIPWVRVDSFGIPRQEISLPDPEDPFTSRRAPNAQLFLLTHAHSDHLGGLDDKFTGTIVCTPETKAMVLALEAEESRLHKMNGVVEVTRKKYPRLQAYTTKSGYQVDHFVVMRYGEVKEWDFGFYDGIPVKVKVTCLDANHCPGSAMFLIESGNRAVLHTGDVRADQPLIDCLRRQPSVQRFLTPMTPHPKSGLFRALDRIVLDTSCLLGTREMPPREEALETLVRYITFFPPDTVFFFNIWTWGWEDVLRVIAREFGCKIHVDRYKRDVYHSLAESDPLLASITTLDPNETRFHACERNQPCASCGNVAGRLVVQVNMAEVKPRSWEEYQLDLAASFVLAARGQSSRPTQLCIPFPRHSPLDEMQNLVKLFTPRSLSPNTLIPHHHGLDYFFLPALFGDFLCDGGRRVLERERDIWMSKRPNGPAHLEALKASHDPLLYLAHYRHQRTERVDADGIASKGDGKDPTDLVRELAWDSEVITKELLVHEITGCRKPWRGSGDPNVGVKVEYSNDVKTHQVEGDGSAGCSKGRRSRAVKDETIMRLSEDLKPSVISTDGHCSAMLASPDEHKPTKLSSLRKTKKSSSCRRRSSFTPNLTHLRATAASLGVKPE